MAMPYEKYHLENNLAIRNKIIMDLHKKGFPSKDIAFIMNRSEQLISHIIKTNKKIAYGKKTGRKG